MLIYFIRFLARVPPDQTPQAIGIFYDHWKVSQGSKIGGLYFTILNVPPSIYLAPDNKFVLALVPEHVNVQEALALTLGCLVEHLGCIDIHIAEAI
jgi:hypothetical protein